MLARKFNLAVTAFVAAAYAWLGWNIIDAMHYGAGQPVCLFKLATQLPCPSCGTTRAVLAAADGNLLEAIMINPLGLAAGFALVVVPLWAMLDLLRGRDSLWQAYRRMKEGIQRSRALSFSLAAAVMANWIWNVMKGL